ncbi:Sugar transporter 12 [Operophtera brumata]|uniref:Sugar transporter 12 n=1 Tax=Operophtera brumata TaxID=104452 RepID=A0A0L7LS42_OPEBR|nr:Sugar transporter 12 [Operophtera brumata]
MVAAQQALESDVPLSDDEMSWVASASNVTTIFGLALAAVVTEKFGRRKAITILTMPVVICWMAMYLAQRMLVFMIARIILGMCFGGVLSLCVLATAEYTAPNVRGFYLNMIITAGASLGVAISNILGILFHWRTVAWIGIIPASISALVPFLWVESPTWLASKGRFEECATAFKALHGNEKASLAELHLLIKIETQKQSDIGGPSQSPALILRKLTTALRQKYLWKIAVLCTCLHIFRVASCRVLICTFVITMIQNITGTSDILLFTLVADGCLVLGSFLSCFLIDRMKMRTLLFYSGIAANIILIALRNLGNYVIKSRLIPKQIYYLVPLNCCRCRTGMTTSFCVKESYLLSQLIIPILFHQL